MDQSQPMSAATPRAKKPMQRFRVAFWQESGGSFFINAKSRASAERIAERIVEDRDFEAFDVDWSHGDSGVCFVEEAGAR